KRTKEKCLVADNGTASCCAILIAPEFRFCGIEELARIEVVVAEEFIHTSVEVVRARSRHCGYNRLSLPELGREGVAIDLEFLNRVDTQIQRQIVESQRTGHDTIDQVIGRRIAPTFDSHILIASAVLRAALKRFWNDTRGNRRQLRQVPPIERQLSHTL